MSLGKCGPQEGDIPGKKSLGRHDSWEDVPGKMWSLGRCRQEDMVPRKMFPGRCPQEAGVFGKETFPGRRQPWKDVTLRKKTFPARRCPWEGVIPREVSLERICPQAGDITMKEMTPFQAARSQGDPHPSRSSLKLGTHERAAAKGSWQRGWPRDTTTLGGRGGHRAGGKQRLPSPGSH